MGCRLIMGDGFDFADIEVQRFFQQGFAVARNAGLGDKRAVGQAAVHFFDDLFGGHERAAFVILIVRIEDFQVFAQQDGLDRRRAGVEAQVARPAVGGQVAVGDGMLRVALLKFAQLFFAVEEGIDAVRFCQRRFVDVFQLSHEVHEGYRRFVEAAQSRADGYVYLGVFRRDDVVVV